MLHEVPAVPDRTNVGGVGGPFELVLVTSGVHSERGQFRQSVRRDHQDMIGFITSRTTPFTRGFHQSLVFIEIDRQGSLLGHHGGEVDGKTEGVMQTKGVLSLEASAGGPLGGIIEEFEASIQRSPEGFLLLVDDGHHLILPSSHLGEDITQDIHHRRNDRCEERLLHAEGLASVADRSSENPAQHVAPTVRAGHRTVGDGGRQASRVVGQDSIGHVVACFKNAFVGGRITGLPDLLEDRCPEIGVVIAALVLQHRHQSFESHSGVDVSCRQGNEAAG